MLLISENCTHYISKIFFQDNDPFVWGILRIFDPDKFEGNQRANIVNLRGLLGSGCKPPVSVIIHGLWSISNVCEKIVGVKGCDVTINLAFAGAGVVKCMSDTTTSDNFESVRFAESMGFSNASISKVPEDCILKTMTFTNYEVIEVVEVDSDWVGVNDNKSFSDAEESLDSKERVFSRNEIILKYGLNSPEAKSTKHLFSVSESELRDLADEWSSKDNVKSSGVVNIVKKSIEKGPESNDYIIRTKQATHKLPLEEGNRDVDKLVELMREIIGSEDPELIGNVFRSDNSQFLPTLAAVPADDPNYKEMMRPLLHQFFRNIPEAAHLSNINVVRDKSAILLDDTRFSAINRIVNSYKKYYELKKHEMTPDEMLDLKKLLTKDVEVLFGRVKDKIKEGSNYNSLFGLTQFSQEISLCGMELSKLRKRCLLALDDIGFVHGGIARAFEDLADKFYNLLWKYVIGDTGDEVSKEFGVPIGAALGSIMGKETDQEIKKGIGMPWSKGSVIRRISEDKKFSFVDKLKSCKVKQFGDLDSTEKQAVVGAGLIGAGGDYFGGKLGAGAKAASNYVKSHPELIKGSKLVKSSAYYEAIKKGQSKGGKIGLVAGGLGAAGLAYNRLKNRKRT